MSRRPDFDFAVAPEQRRRDGELRFYRQLACAALLGVLPVIALGWRIDRHTDSLAAANRLLEAELQALQPQLAQAAAARRSIGAMQGRLDGLERQAAQRAQAARLLRGAALAAPLRGRLERIALRAQQAELRGYAGRAQDVQAYAEALAQAGLEGIAIQELRTGGGNAEQARYGFTLALPLPGAQPSRDATAP